MNVELRIGNGEGGPAVVPNHGTSVFAKASTGRDGAASVRNGGFGTSNVERPTSNVELECGIRKVEHRIGKGELLIPTADIEWKRLTGSEVQASFPFRISLRRSTTFSENHATVVCEYPHVDGRRLRYIQQMPSQDGTLG